MPPDNQRSQGEIELDKCLNSLGEHFDSVTIFVTGRVEGKPATNCLVRSSGNWYASYGAMQLWLKEQTLSDVNNEE